MACLLYLPFPPHWKVGMLSYTGSAFWILSLVFLWWIVFCNVTGWKLVKQVRWHQLSLPKLCMNVTMLACLSSFRERERGRGGRECTCVHAHTWHHLSKKYHFAVWAKADWGITFLYKNAEMWYIHLFILLLF
jgi:hypothetical protein